jgi:hypothetical protein
MIYFLLTISLALNAILLALAAYIYIKAGRIFAKVQVWLEDLNKRNIGGDEIYYRNRFGRFSNQLLPLVFDEIMAMDLSQFKGKKG